MIRLFTFLYKTDLTKLPDTLSLFCEIDKSFHIDSAHCPECKSTGHLTMHDDYQRNLVAYENGSVQENQVKVRRVECSSCSTTSAILPDVIVPHKTYSIMFILHVLKAYYFRKETVVALCSRFGIAVATLYAWKKRYLIHKMIYLGKLERYFHEQDPHLSKPVEVFFTDFLASFFKQFGFSFLQYTKAAQTDSS